jgi:hypothetical protein
MKKMSVHIAIVILRYCLAVFDLIPSVQRFPTDVLLQYQITIKTNNMKTAFNTKQTASTDNQPCDNPNCTCDNCTCGSNCTCADCK